MRQFAVNVLALALVFVLARVALPVAMPEQPVHDYHGPRLVILDDHVRSVLAADWDKHASDPVILERAYCVTFRKDVWYVSDWVWRVTDIVPADSVEGATPNAIRSFVCSPAENVTTAHVHPNQSCLSDTDCVNGGSLAFQCFPSDVDRESLRRSGKPFALVICDRNAAIAYYSP